MVFIDLIINKPSMTMQNIIKYIQPVQDVGVVVWPRDTEEGITPYSYENASER